MKLSLGFPFVIGLSCLVACSGRTVRLDHEPAAGGSGASSDDPDGPTLVYQLSGAPLNPGELLVDDRRVYWQSTDQAFRSCLKDDCQRSVVTYTTSSDLDSAGVQRFSNIAVSAGQAFWLAQPPRGTIYSCPSSGCATEPTRLLRDPSLPRSYGLVADEGAVYWLSTREVYRCAAAGCAAGPQLTSLGEGALPLFFGSEAFWILDVDRASRIRRAPKDGSSAASTLVEVSTPDQGGRIQEIAVSSQFVYWLDDESRILRCPFSGCDAEPTLLETEGGTKLRLRADELGVYWLDSSDSPNAPFGHEAVHFCPNAGCPSTTSLGRFEQLQTYALDVDFVYFTEHVTQAGTAVGGEIMRMPKPRL